MEGVAARQALESEPYTFNESMDFTGVEGVLRAARIETAARSQQWTQHPLVEADRCLYYRFAHASMTWFHNRCKPARSTGALASRAAVRAPMTKSAGGSRC